MPVVEDPAVSSEDKDIDEQDDLSNSKSFFTVDQNC